MIRGTVNETAETIDKDAVHLSETYEVVAGSPDGLAPVATVELREIDLAGLDPGNTYPIIPSSAHNGPKE